MVLYKDFAGRATLEISGKVRNVSCVNYSISLEWKAQSYIVLDKVAANLLLRL